MKIPKIIHQTWKTSKIPYELQKDLGKIKELVKDARFCCKNCGRAAHAEENLCNPSRI